MLNFFTFVKEIVRFERFSMKAFGLGLLLDFATKLMLDEDCRQL